MKQVFFVSLMLYAFSSNAQNLVPNPSFEDYVQCPDDASQYIITWPLPIIQNVISWSNPNLSSPDYYNVCSNSGSNDIVKIPKPGNSPWGQPPYFYYQPPLDGEAFVGIGVFDINNNQIREYLQVQLTEPLLPFGIYRISFYASLADSYVSTYAIKELGCLLSDTSIYLSSTKVIERTDAIYNTQDVFFDDTLGWQHFEAEYQAHGGEEYLLIGNFKRDEETTIYDYCHIGGSGTYYLIDDVSVTFKSVSVKETNSKNQNYFNWHQTDQKINIESLGDSHFHLTMINSIGSIIYNQSNSKSEQLEINLENLPAGIYFIQLKFDNEIINLKILI